MAKMITLKGRIHSGSLSPWGSFLPQTKSRGALQPKNGKVALSQSAKNSRDTKDRESRVAASPRLPAPSFANGNGACTLSSSNILPITPMRAKRRARDRTQRKILFTQFRFQSFKKCFHTKCATIIVPSDFKPCSPRRMFCSLECFEAHWKAKLSGSLWKPSQATQ